jgi:hypothetical protein
MVNALGEQRLFLTLSASSLLFGQSKLKSRNHLLFVGVSVSHRTLPKRTSQLGWPVRSEIQPPRALRLPL